MLSSIVLFIFFFSTDIACQRYLPIQESSCTGSHEASLGWHWKSATFQLVYCGLPSSGLTTSKATTTKARLECYRLQRIAHPMAIDSCHFNERHRIVIRHRELPGLYRQQHGAANSFVSGIYQRNLPTQESDNVDTNGSRLASHWKLPTIQVQKYCGLQSSSLTKGETNR